MPPLPPLSFSDTANALGGTAGGGWMQGDWNVNLGGSGIAFQGGMPPWLLLGLAAGAAWLLMRRR